MAATLAHHAERTLAQETSPRVLVSNLSVLIGQSLIRGDRRNMVNITLFLAEHCKRYYPSEEIPIMLSTFIPLVTKDVSLQVMHILSPDTFPDDPYNDSCPDIIPAPYSHPSLPSHAI